MKEITVELPDPGQRSDHHEDDEIVWYHGKYGEFIVDNKVMTPPLPRPITDENGDAYTVKDLRDMAYAALACADAAEALGHPTE